MIHTIYITSIITLCALFFYLGRHWNKSINIPWLNSYSSPSNEPVYDFKPEEASATQADVNKVVEALEKEHKDNRQQKHPTWLRMNE